MSSESNLRFFYPSPLLADDPLPDPASLSTPASPPSAQPDPLVDQGGHNIVILGAVLIMIGGVALVGIFSRKIEHVIVAALAMSLLCIGFFVVTRH